MEQRLRDILDELKGKNHITSRQTNELFEVHNHYYPGNQEFGKKCPTCRNRVYNRMKALLEQMDNGNK